MNHRIGRFLRDLFLALTVVLIFLAIQKISEPKKSTEQVLDAYRRGVTIGTIKNQISGEPLEVQAQLAELCEKTWPATSEAKLAHKRACSGVLVGGID